MNDGTLPLSDHMTDRVPSLQTIMPSPAHLRLEEAAEKAREYAGKAKAPNTLRSYRAAWNDFAAWCAAGGRTPLPALSATLAMYLADRADTHKTATLQHRLAAISQAHQRAGFGDLNPCRDPQVREVWKGIRRDKGTAPSRKTPVLTADLRRMLAALSRHRLIDRRDAALLLFGFTGALRRSELVALDVSHVEITRDGLVVTIVRSKTDGDGEGFTLGLPYTSDPESCPVRALLAWLEAAAITEGPIFRAVNRHGRLAPERLSHAAVALIVQKHAGRLGLDATRFAGHSLRAGFATSAAMEDVPERDAMAHMRQKSVNVHRGYVRQANLFKRNPVARLGL
jgi:integrase